MEDGKGEGRGKKAGGIVDRKINMNFGKEGGG